MKIKVLLVTLAVITTMISGCAQKGGTTTPQQNTQQQQPATQAPKTDATTTASIVNNEAAFLKAVSKEGTWIICTLNDMTISKEIVVDGDFKNKKKDATTGAELYQRKIGLYTQDDAKKVTARFTLTAPKITFNSINGSLEHGTFKGDVYVTGKNFRLVNQQIQGNLYFLNEEAKNTFKIDDKEGNPPSKVTGVTELKK
jgi:DUF4097 and DUF4098 domain-containing protein YvlB